MWYFVTVEGNRKGGEKEKEKEERRERDFYQ